MSGSLKQVCCSQNFFEKRLDMIRFHSVCVGHHLRDHLKNREALAERLSTVTEIRVSTAPGLRSNQCTTSCSVHVSAKSRKRPPHPQNIDSLLNIFTTWCTVFNQAQLQLHWHHPRMDALIPGVPSPCKLKLRHVQKAGIQSVNGFSPRALRENSLHPLQMAEPWQAQTAAKGCKGLVR